MTDSKVVVEAIATPRTDALRESLAVSILSDADMYCFMVEHANQLERELAEANRKLAGEVTGEMWSAGRKEFEKQARQYNEAKEYEVASAYADRAPEEIYKAMCAARPKGDV